jgi:hypothetical protein
MRGGRKERAQGGKRRRDSGIIPLLLLFLFPIVSFQYGWPDLILYLQILVPAGTCCQTGVNLFKLNKNLYWIKQTSYFISLVYRLLIEQDVKRVFGREELNFSPSLKKISLFYRLIF